MRIALAALAAFFPVAVQAVEELWRMAPSADFPLHDRVRAQVLVIPFTDRNGDGSIDAADGGDVIVLGHHNQPDPEAQLRVLDGRTGIDLWAFDPPPGGAALAPRTAPAAGDVDGDGFPEIVVSEDNVPGRDALIYMYDWDGTVRWTSPMLIEWSVERDRSISLADLDGDGISEILASNVVLNADGTHRMTLETEQCRETFALDFDLDGTLEVVCGDSVADASGAVLRAGWNDRAISAPAQLDDDSNPELLILHGGRTRLEAVDDDFSLLWTAPGEGGGVPVAFAAGDFDGDGYTDVVAGDEDEMSDWEIVAWDHLGEERWRTPAEDPGIVVGGSLAFVNGPLAYLHDDFFATRLLDPLTGDETLRLDNEHGTFWENPVFADLDGDGRGELITTSDVDPAVGVRAWRDETWCFARPFWTQHAHATAWIGDDLRPAGPSAEPIDWASVGFRQQADGCTCVTPPDVTITVSWGCAPGVLCASVTAEGAAAPTRLDWVLPDGTPSGEDAPCFVVDAPGRLEVMLEDAVGCVVTTAVDVAPPVARTLTVELLPTCASSEQCVQLELDELELSALSWTLPDGSQSMEAEPCFDVVADGTLGLEATDTDGCPWSLDVPVEPFVEPALQELSAPGAVTPLTAWAVGRDISIAWEASLTGQPMACWAGDVGAWNTHELLACTTDASSIDPAPIADRYYLAGELRCDGSSGPLGADSFGTARRQPAASCP